MIQRYRYDAGDGNWRFPGHVPDAKGEFVSYEDHQAEVAAAFRAGKDEGFNEGYYEGVIDERGSH